MKEELYLDIAQRIKEDKRLCDIPTVCIAGAGRAADAARGALTALQRLDDHKDIAISFATPFLPRGITRAVIIAPDTASARRWRMIRDDAAMLVLDLSDDGLYVTDILRMAFIVLKKGKAGAVYPEDSLKKAGFERFINDEDSRSLYAGFSSDNDIFVFPDAGSKEFKSLQAKELEILVETDRVCKENGIRYSLAGGTLLGAVRHGGFIPWDYDIDIMMDPENFEKFQGLSDKFGERFFLQTPGTDKGNYFFTKVRMNSTLMTTEMTDKLKNIHNGIFIDVFVHNYTAKTKAGQRLHALLTKCARSLVYNKWNGSSVHGARGSNLNPAVRLAATVLKTILPMKLLCALQFYITGFFKKDTGFMYDGAGQHLSRGAFPSSRFSEYTTLEFEGRSFPVIKEYEKYLEYLYGSDFYTLPAASRRHISHEIKRLKL